VNGAANRTTDLRLIEHLVHDLSDATGAAAAPRPAAEASVYIARGTAYRRPGDSSNFMVAQHVAEQTIISSWFQDALRWRGLSIVVVLAPSLFTIQLFRHSQDNLS
jgi:hypothetical protein